MTTLSKQPSILGATKQDLRALFRSLFSLSEGLNPAEDAIVCYLSADGDRTDTKDVNLSSKLTESLNGMDTGDVVATSWGHFQFLINDSQKHASYSSAESIRDVAYTITKHMHNRLCELHGNLQPTFDILPNDKLEAAAECLMDIASYWEHARLDARLRGHEQIALAQTKTSIETITSLQKSRGLFNEVELAVAAPLPR